MRLAPIPTSLWAAQDFIGRSLHPVPACHVLFAEIRTTAPPDREAAAPPRSSGPSRGHLFAGVQYLGATAGQPSRAGWRMQALDDRAWISVEDKYLIIQDIM